VASRQRPLPGAAGGRVAGAFARPAPQRRTRQRPPPAAPGGRVRAPTLQRRVRHRWRTPVASR